MFSWRGEAPYPDRRFVQFRRIHGLPRETVTYLSQIDQPYRHGAEREVRASEAASARAEADSLER
jgi:hypothetical protein